MEFTRRLNCVDNGLDSDPDNQGSDFEGKGLQVV